MIWTILGVAVSVAAAFCIISSELLRHFPALDSWRGVFAAVLAVCGAIVGLTGMFKARAHPEPDEELRKSLSYKLEKPFWGGMLLACAVIALFIQPLYHQQTVVAPAPAAPASPPVVKVAPAPIKPPTPTNPPVVFPPLKIQGCILGEDKPVVLIDGKAYGVGDQVRGLTVKSVTREVVVLEKSGQTKTYKVP